LLNLKHRVQPEAYVSLREPNDAFLLVGNRALRQRRGARGFPHKYDLGQEWNVWTGLPFVFSRWIVRKDLDSKDIALLEDTLYVGLEDGVDSLYHLNEPREDLLMLPKDIVDYIQGLRYYVGLSEQKAIDQFRQYLEQLDG
jgi:chorismate dehydratase